MEELMTDKERHDTKMATLYELRLLIANDDRKEYTKDDILQIIDTIASIKKQK